MLQNKLQHVITTSYFIYFCFYFDVISIQTRCVISVQIDNTIWLDFNRYRLSFLFSGEKIAPN